MIFPITTFWTVQHCLNSNKFCNPCHMLKCPTGVTVSQSLSYPIAWKISSQGIAMWTIRPVTVANSALTDWL